MKRKMHAKTMAIVLATTTALQLTGVASQLLNGVPFEIVNAAGPLISTITSKTTTDSSVIVTTGAGVIAPVSATLIVPNHIEVDLNDTIEYSVPIELRVTTSGGVKIENIHSSIIKHKFNEMHGTLHIDHINGYRLDQTYTYHYDIAVTNDPRTGLSVDLSEGSDQEGDFVNADMFRNGNEYDDTNLPITYEWHVGNVVTTSEEASYSLNSTDRDKDIFVNVLFDGIFATSSSAIKYDWYESEVPVDRYDLEVDIANAKAEYDVAVEGTEIGQYKSGAKAAFKAAIDAAQAVLDNASATQDEVDDATDALEVAESVFGENKVIDTTIAAVPTKVGILGSERVGKTLSVNIYDQFGKEFTSNSGLTYRWYRLSDASKDVTDNDFIGTGETYKLTGNDKNKYIRVFVSYNGMRVGEDTTSKIDRSSSSSSLSSSSSKSSSSSSESNNSSSSNSSSAATDNSSSNNSVASGSTTATAEIKQAADGRIQLVTADGQAAQGWQQVNGTWYLANANGTAQTGWQQVNGNWYLLGSNGAMQTGWKEVNGTWYLLDDSGAMKTGWQQVNGTWYYLYVDGTMASNTTVDGYTVNESGAWV